MEEIRKNNKQGIMWLPPDAITGNAELKREVFSLLCSPSMQRQHVMLKRSTDYSVTTPYFLSFADKLSPYLWIWELQIEQRDFYNWVNSIFLFPVIAAVMMIYDPITQYDILMLNSPNISEAIRKKIDESVSRRTYVQNQYVLSCLNHVKASTDLPILLIYIKETSDSKSLEELIDLSHLLSPVSSVIYLRGNLSTLPDDMLRFLSDL